MKQYHLSVIGQFHTNHNEDFWVSCPLSNTVILLAVMDGCSMGKESHFASALCGKLLRKISTQTAYQTFITKQEVSLYENLKGVMKQLFANLQQLKNDLMLEVEELLNTLLIGVYHVEDRHAHLLSVGDCLVACNGKLYEYEQDNRPDYLGYHLDEDFELWWAQQTQQLELKQVQDLSIVTDGIFTFQAFDNDHYEKISMEEIIPYLLLDQTWKDQPQMLKKKLLKLEKENGLKPNDDLTIIRLIN